MTLVKTPVESPPKASGQLKSAVRAAMIGTFIEWFDYAAYMYMAAVIATVFFPSLEGRLGLIITFALFALSFLIRPIGAVFWGHIGDKLGRTRTLSTSIIIMSLATALIALLPGYESIGFWAPLLLLALRMAQGFSASGEYAAAATYLTESAPLRRKGFFASVIPAATATGLLFGSLFAALLNAALDDAALQSWGWRIPFLLAAPLGILGLWLRKSAPESEEFSNTEVHESHLPIREVFKSPRAVVVSFAGAILNAIGFYIILTYLPTYLSEELGMDTTASFIATTISSATYIGFVLLTGTLSDRFGRHRSMLVATACFILLSVPAFVLLDTEAFAVIVLIQVIMGAVLALNDGVLPSFLSEQFEPQVRLTGFALTFNLANAIFGGTAPMVATWLIDLTGSNLAPAYYLVFAACVTAAALLVARTDRNDIGSDNES